MAEQTKKSPVMAIVVVVVIIGIAIVAYFVTQNSGNENTNVSNTNKEATENRYTAETFSIVQPEDWEQVSIQGALVAFRDPNDIYPEGSVEATNQFKSYMAVVFDNVHDRTLDEIVKLNEDSTVQVNPSATFTKETDETIDGQSAKIVEGQIIQQDVNFSIFMAFAMKGNRYFVVTGNTVTDKWDDYKDIFYETARSFQFEYEEEDTNTNADTNQ